MNKLIFAASLLACTAAQAQHDTIFGLVIDTGAMQREAYRVPTTTVKNDTIPALFLCVENGTVLLEMPAFAVHTVRGFWIRRRRVEKVTPLPYWETLPSLPAITRLESVYEDALPSLPDPANCLGADKKPLGKIVFAVYIIK